MGRARSRGGPGQGRKDRTWVGGRSRASPPGQRGRAHLEVISHGQLRPGRWQGVGTALCWRRSGRKEKADG